MWCGTFTACNFRRIWKRKVLEWDDKKWGLIAYHTINHSCPRPSQAGTAAGPSPVNMQLVHTSGSHHRAHPRGCNSWRLEVACKKRRTEGSSRSREETAQICPHGPFLGRSPATRKSSTFSNVGLESHTGSCLFCLLILKRSADLCFYFMLWNQ